MSKETVETKTYYVVEADVYKVNSYFYRSSWSVKKAAVEAAMKLSKSPRGTIPTRVNKVTEAIIFNNKGKSNG